MVGNYQHLGLFDGKDLAISAHARACVATDEALGESQELRVGSD